LEEAFELLSQSSRLGEFQLAANQSRPLAVEESLTIKPLLRLLRRLLAQEFHELRLYQGLAQLQYLEWLELQQTLIQLSFEEE